MSKGFFETLALAAPEQVLFTRADGGDVTAADVRVMAIAASRKVKPSGGCLYLHTRRASAFAAGLLTASLLNRELAILPHVQPDYLRLLGVDETDLLSDDGDNALLQDVGAGDGAICDPGQLSSPPLAFYTSGSTSAPKKAEKDIAQLELEARSWERAFAGEIDAVAGTVSHQHIYGCLFRVVLPVLAGLPSTDIQAFTWESFIAQLGPRILGVTSPAHLTRIPPNLDLAGKTSLFLISSGQALPFTAAQQAAEIFGAPPMEILGSTETGGVATRKSAAPDELWTPLPVVKVRKSEAGTLEIQSPFAGSDDFLPMGDQVEITEAGKFRLLARADRIAKIEGKRVSLRRVESILASHPDISQARVLVTEDAGRERLSAVVVPNEAGGRKLGPIGSFRYSRALLADLADKFEVSERPKRWRFVSSLPQTAQAKTPQSLLDALFAQPSILSRLKADRVEIGEDQALIAFDVPAELPWFEGHFPGAPILPGVAQVHIAARLAEEIWAFAPCNHEVTRMKFHRVIFPGDKVALTIAREMDPDRVRYTYRINDATASEGVIGAARIEKGKG